jgi:Asparagine synthase
MAPRMASIGLPLVCGALGRASPRALRRMRKALGKPGRVHRDREAALFLDREPLRWRGSGGHGFAWAESLPVATARPRTWREASEEWGASGLAFEDGRWLLHASVSGLGPLYFIDTNDATYFSSRIDALVAMAEGRLTVDWAAWSGIFAVGYPLGARTPFAEIRRLEPSGYLTRSSTGAEVSRGGWPWAEIEPGDSSQAPERIVEALRDRLSELPREVEVHSLLSGGWDSRLLLALLNQQGDRRIRAWTVNNDVGHRDEERIAGLVTEKLGVRHQIVPPEVGRFWADWEETAARQDFQAPTRIRVLRLARLLREAPGIALEGVAGDIFIKGLYVNRAMLEAATWSRVADLLWRRVFQLRGGPPLFARGFLGRTFELARSGFDREVDRFRDHPAGATLAIYWLRTRRSIGAGPLELVGSQTPVSIPFAGDRVVRAALAVAPREKLSSALYKRVWERADPEIAALPSTNDPGYDPGPRDFPRIVLSRQAVRGYVDVLSRHPLRPLFSKRLDGDVEDGRLRPYLRNRQKLQALDALCRFGLWHERYGERLEPLDVDRLRSEERAFSG